MKHMNALTAVMVITIVTALTNPVMAKENPNGLGLHSLGGRLGLMSPENLGSTLGFAVYADLGEVVPKLALFPSISFWQKGSSQTYTNYAYNPNTLDYESVKIETKTSFRQIGIQCDAHYYFNPEAKLNFYAGGGLGMFLHGASVSANGGQEGAIASSGSVNRFGFNLLAGVESPVGAKTRFVGEARYTVVESFSTMGLTVGLEFDLL